jgi:hypothetical protein
VSWRALDASADGIGASAVRALEERYQNAACFEPGAMNEA